MKHWVFRKVLRTRKSKKHIVSWPLSTTPTRAGTPKISNGFRVLTIFFQMQKRRRILTGSGRLTGHLSNKVFQAGSHPIYSPRCLVVVAQIHLGFNMEDLVGL